MKLTKSEKWGIVMLFPSISIAAGIFAIVVMLCEPPPEIAGPLYKFSSSLALFFLVTIASIASLMIYMILNLNKRRKRR